MFSAIRRVFQKQVVVSGDMKMVPDVEPQSILARFADAIWINRKVGIQRIGGSSHGSSVRCHGPCLSQLTLCLGGP